MGGSAANDASCADGVVESHEFAGATAFCGAAAWTLWPRASIPPFNANASDEAASEADLCAETNAFSAAHYGASADTDDASRADANAFAADAAKMVSDAPRMGMRRRA